MCNDNPTQPITSYGKSYIICQYLYLKAILQSFHNHFNSKPSVPKISKTPAWYHIKSPNISKRNNPDIRFEHP